MAPYANEQGTRCCPACSATHPQEVETDGVRHWRCRKCEAIFSDTIYLGESYTLVRPFLHPTPQEVPPEGARYFDFLALGSKGVRRRHGWFDLLTRLIVQVG